MSDIGASEIGDGAARAPFRGDLHLVLAEGAVILRHIGDAAEAQAGDAREVLGHMEEQPVDSVVVLGDFLDHDDMVGEVRRKFGSNQHGERRQIKRDSRAIIEVRLKTAAFAGQSAERAVDSGLSAFAPDVPGERSVGNASDAMLVERRE